MAYAIVQEERREAVNAYRKEDKIPKERRESLKDRSEYKKERSDDMPRDRLTSLSLYLTEVGYPKTPSREEERNLFYQLAQSRRRFFEHLCKHARKELFEELERIIANPDEDFSLAGLDTKSDSEKQAIVTSCYINIKKLEKTLDSRVNGIINGAINGTIEKIDRQVKAYSLPENMRDNEETVYSKMAEFLEQMHIINSYYERVVEKYKRRLKAGINERLRADINGKLMADTTEKNENYKKIIEVSNLLKDYITAWDKIINTYLGYVVHFAKKYDGKSFENQRKLDIEDLIQEGNIGLMKAIERFDITLGVKFSSYAGLIIRGEICRAIDDKSRMIRIPPNFHKLCREYERAREECVKILQREPTRDEVYERLGIDDEQITALESRGNVTNILEMDKLVGEKRQSSLISLVPSNEPSPLAIVEDVEYHNNLQNDVKAALEQRLSERERRVLSLHFGLNGNRDAVKITDLAKEAGISRNMIHRVQKRAIEKIRPYIVAYK